ncbi:hypothetical protein LSCM4_06528 [Leishmania orientalis]|uniref:Uncharacterized protein n=1 Tax=Leishmania orientalis TaxID=2249476 RepID=A0A836GFC2_9TRYP|nr:hypothetical protein LSCM4_06528 [Leishmania orientalis]
MFGRRVASCCGIPANMYARLHISSPQQANRMVRPLVPITTSMCRSVSGGTGAFASLVAGSEVVPADLTSPANLLSLIGVTPQVLLGTINANPLLLRMISDTMCTYSVILLHATGSNGIDACPPVLRERIGAGRVLRTRSGKQGLR